MSLRPFLHGFGVTGYRSFHASQPVRLTGMGKINLIVGPNNSGKSNFLRAIQRLVPELPVGGSSSVFDFLSGLELPEGTVENRDLVVDFGFELDESEIRSRLDQRSRKLNSEDSDRLIALLKSGNLYEQESNTVWCRFKIDPTANSDTRRFWFDRRFLESAQGYQSQMWGNLSSVLDSRAGGPSGDDAERVLSNVFDVLPKLAVKTIGAERSIKAGTDSDGGLEGQGLISRLQQLQNPSEDYDFARERFGRINRFVADVFGDEDANIEIPHDASTIMVTANGRRLPLESVGTGLLQLIVLAAAATVEQDTILCIEEPETNMHPLLQRKLLRYLNDHTNNQYVIATHSAAMIDLNLATIYSATITDKSQGTTSKRIDKPDEHALVAMELGYRASDIVQSNAIIWVEGPSDRIYLSHWLKMVAPELIEGYHYTIMFYGGSLLSHLTANDQEIQDFISLSRINRNSAILIDSDRTGPRKRISENKRRVKDEFNHESRPGFAWITDGYTIENCVPAQLLLPAIKKVHSKSNNPKKVPNEYTNPLALDYAGTAHPNKVAIAAEVVTQWTDEHPLEGKLKKHVNTAAQFIRNANDLT